MAYVEVDQTAAASAMMNWGISRVDAPAAPSRAGRLAVSGIGVYVIDTGVRGTTPISTS